MRTFIITLCDDDTGWHVFAGYFTNDAPLWTEPALEPVTLLGRDGFMVICEAYDDSSSSLCLACQATGGPDLLKPS